MKIYFHATGQYYKEQRELYDKIIKSLKEFTGKEPYVALSDIDYENDSEVEITEAVKRMVKQLKQADVIITENTYSKAGIGFDVATALNMKKPVLVLDLIEASKKGPHPINRLSYKLLSYKNYNANNVEAVLKDFIHTARQKMDSKFILIISPEIEKYLEWSSDTNRLHKAQIVRQAIEDQLGKDKEYLDHLKNENNS